MRHSRKSSQASKITSARRALVRILSQLHYRHEFARRNSGVADACKKIIQELGLPSTIRFGDPVRNVTVCEMVIDAYYKRKGRRSGLRSSLASFLTKHSILPMGSLGAKTPFVPSSYFSPKTDEYLMWEAFNSLLRFEAFAVAELGLRRPVMFPLLLIKDVRFCASTAMPLRGLDMDNYSFPILMDLTVPDKSANAYLAMLRVQVNLTMSMMDAAVEPKNRRPSRLAKDSASRGPGRIKIEREKGGEIRLHEEKFPAFLAIYDFEPLSSHYSAPRFLDN